MSMSDYKEGKNFKMELRKHKKNYSGLKSDQDSTPLNEIKFDPCDPKKKFYRLIQTNMLGLSVRQGFKLFEICENQETLAKSCLCLLQSHSAFPVKIFMVEYQNDQMFKNGNKKFIKSLWLQTRIEKTSQSTGQQEQQQTKKFEMNIHKFFMQELIPRLESFKKNFLSQQAMFSSEDNEETILQKFKNEILVDSNEKFTSYMNQSSEDAQEN